jgi:hypothetical protein
MTTITHITTRLAALTAVATLVLAAAAQAHPVAVPLKVGETAIGNYANRVGNRIGAGAVYMYGCKERYHAVACTIGWDVPDPNDDSETDHCTVLAAAFYPSVASSSVAVEANSSAMKCTARQALNLG